MSLDRNACRLMRRLSHPPFTNVTSFCGNDENQGHDEVPEWQIWTDQRTTKDQFRIEEELERLILPASSILHIGAGNSSLARRFAPRVTMIIGTTLHDEERARAGELRIPNYDVVVINKFSRDMAQVGRQFDFIVDNNPSTFACCLFHFCRMMVVYGNLLREGGSILTAEPGLSWISTGNNPEWFLTWRDWVRLGEALCMPTQQLTEFVYSMHRVVPGGGVGPTA